MKFQSKIKSLTALAGILASVNAIGTAHADDISFSSVGLAPFGFLTNTYTVVEGAASAPPGLSAPYNLGSAFTLTVGAGTGAAAALVGQQFLGFCVNFGFGDPDAGVGYTLSTNGNDLSYDPDDVGNPVPDLWAVNRTAKYDAIRDVISAYGAGIASLDQNTADFQQRALGLSMALWEITADYDPIAGLGSLSLVGGDYQLYDINGIALTNTDASYGYFQQYILSAGTGVGAGSTLYGAGTADRNYQDVILVPVPEPATTLLGGLALLGFMRRKRS